MIEQSRRALFAVLLAAILFGTTGTAQQLGPSGTSPLGVGLVRIALGSLGLLAASRRLTGGPPSRGLKSAYLLAGLGVAGYQVGFFIGTERSGVALGTVVALGSGPIFAGVFEAVRSRRLPHFGWILATALAGAGVALVAYARSGETSGVAFAGIAAALGAGVSYTVFSVAAKKVIAAGVPSLRVMANAFALGTCVLSPLVLTESFRWLSTGRGLLMALHLGIAATALAYALFGYGLARLGVPVVVTLTLAEPATAAVLSVLILHQRLGPLGWTGVLLVLAGVVVIARGATTTA